MSTRKGGSSVARAVGVTKRGQSYRTQAGARDPVGGTPWKGEDTSKNSEMVHNFQGCGGIMLLLSTMSEIDCSEGSAGAIDSFACGCGAILTDSHGHHRSTPMEQ